MRVSLGLETRAPHSPSRAPRLLSGEFMSSRGDGTKCRKSEGAVSAHFFNR